MPQPSSTKRTNLLPWIGLLVVVVIAAAVVKALFLAPTISSVRMRTGAAGSAQMVAPLYGESARAPSFASDMAYAVAPPMMGQSPSSAAGSVAMPLDTAAPAQRVIKTGEVALRVQDAQTAIIDTRTIVEAKNGFVESSSISDSGAGPRIAWMTVRIPANQFDATLTELKAKAVVVLNESTRGQDVTAEFVDLESDLRNAKAEEASYLEIMKRAGKIDDVLQVARALADVRGRIEQLEGRKRFMESRTDLATISLTLTEETRVEVPGRTWKPLEVLRQAMNDLVISLQALVDFLIRAVIAVVGLLLPIALIVALMLWVIWKIFRAIGKRISR